MALTPVEIRHIKPSRSLLGYNRKVVDELLEDVVESFEQVWRERADLADKVERLEADLVRYRELETLLRTTLVSAERASQELREQARREAERRCSRRRTPRRAASGARRSPTCERMRTEARTHPLAARRRARRRSSSTDGAERKPRPRRRRAKLRPGASAADDTAASCGSRPVRRRVPGSSAVTATRGRSASPEPPEDGRANEAVLRLLARDARRAARERLARFRTRRAGQDRRRWTASSRRRRSGCWPTRGKEALTWTPIVFAPLCSTSARASRARSSTCTARRPARSRTRRRRCSARPTTISATPPPATLDREIDYTLEEPLRAGARADRRRAGADRRRHVRHVRELRQADRPRSDWRRGRGRACASTARERQSAGDGVVGARRRPTSASARRPTG